MLRIREPDWHQHRLFKRIDRAVNLHVFTAGCEEITRNLLFRDWLRTHGDDRRRYEQTKRRLAAQRWDFVQDYADAKSATIEQIIARAEASATGT